MKINIFTYYYTNNYGALLQAICLRNFLEKNYNNKVFFNHYLPKELIFAEIYKPLITKKLKKTLNFFLKNIKFRNWKKKYGLKKPQYKIKSFEDNCISIYGSDEIWNFENKYFGYEPHFFGLNNKGPKIAFSASIGRANYQNLKASRYENIKTLLKQFESISVRDSGTFDFIKKLIGVEPIVTVDPTLLYNKDLKPNFNFQKSVQLGKYALVYGVVFTSNQILKIRKYCENKKLKILSIGYENYWADTNIVIASPEDFINFIYFSETVFTSMFHGIMFSVKFRKQFWYSEDPIRKNKIDYFLTYLNLKHRNINYLDNIDTDLEYAEMNDKLSLWQNISRKYLLNSINKTVI